MNIWWILCEMSKMNQQHMITFSDKLTRSLRRQLHLLIHLTHWQNQIIVLLEYVLFWVIFNQSMIDLSLFQNIEIVTNCLKCETHTIPSGVGESFEFYPAIVVQEFLIIFTSWWLFHESTESSVEYFEFRILNFGFICCHNSRPVDPMRSTQIDLCVAI